jgi:hypothetical protein
MSEIMQRLGVDGPELEAAVEASEGRLELSEDGTMMRATSPHSLAHVKLSG